MPVPTTQQPNPAFGKIKNLLAGRAGPGSRIFEELAKFSTDYTYFKEDFLGTTAAEGIGASKLWVYNETAAGPVDPVRTTPTAPLTSYVQIELGATDPSAFNLVTLAMWAAKWNPFVEVRFQENLTYANGTVEQFFGFVGALPASAGAILGDIDTPTFAGGVTDAAGIGFDTDETLKTGAHITVGANATVGKTTINTALGAPFTQPTLNVDVTYRVELRSATPDDSVSTSYLFINNFLVDAGRIGPDAEVVMAAAFYAGNRGSDAIYKFDALVVGQEKNGAPW
jgi:hypothetical protein